MSEQPVTDLDSRGFVRVTAPNEADLWLTCQQCQRSDHFLVTDVVRCSCGAQYDHTVTPAGTRVGMDNLTFVPFEQGPMSLADLELDPRRVAILLLVVLAIVSWLWLI